MRYCAYVRSCVGCSLGSSLFWYAKQDEVASSLVRDTGSTKSGILPDGVIA